MNFTTSSMSAGPQKSIVTSSTVDRCRGFGLIAERHPRRTSVWLHRIPHVDIFFEPAETGPLEELNAWLVARRRTDLDAHCRGAPCSAVGDSHVQHRILDRTTGDAAAPQKIDDV